jgi:hypothetical protein
LLPLAAMEAAKQRWKATSTSIAMIESKRPASPLWAVDRRACFAAAAS